MERMKSTIIEREKLRNKGDFKKGHIPWNSGKKGIQKAWNKGLTAQKDIRVKDNVEKAHKTTKKLFNQNKIQIWNKGLTKENNSSVNKIALAKLGNTFGFKKGSQHKFFNNYSSLLPYSPEFNEAFKQAIILRDNNCLICGSNNQLHIHHINYNKLESTKENCICLCRSCHGKTNFNRTSWTKFCQSLLSEKYGYEYSSDEKIILELNAHTEDSDKAKQEVH